MYEVFLKSADMLDDMKKVRNEEIDLEVRLLGRLEELKNALEDISERHTSEGDRWGTC